jgi:hypothetical protein
MGRLGLKVRNTVHGVHGANTCTINFIDILYLRRGANYRTIPDLQLYLSFG